VFQALLPPVCPDKSEQVVQRNPFSAGSGDDVAVELHVLKLDGHAVDAALRGGDPGGEVARGDDGLHEALDVGEVGGGGEPVVVAGGLGLVVDLVALGGEG
jgi:hypothetical protein